MIPAQRQTDLEPSVKVANIYSAVQINVVKGCVSAVVVHTTVDEVYLDSRIRHLSYLLVFSTLKIPEGLVKQPAGSLSSGEQVFTLPNAMESYLHQSQGQRLSTFVIFFACAARESCNSDSVSNRYSEARTTAVS